MIFLASVAVFSLAVGTIAYLTGMLSPKAKKEILQRREKEENLSKQVVVTVTKSGFVKKSAGVEDIYIPLISLRITNISNRSIERLLLYAYFQGKEKDGCNASATIFKLEPGVSVDAELKCLESRGFGTVVGGWNLIRVPKEVTYGVAIDSGGVQVWLFEGKLDFVFL